MPFVRTLAGDVSPEDLGVTYCHDHIFCVPPLWKERGEFDLLLDDEQASETDVALFAKAGGKTIYDATCIDYGRDVATVARIAERQNIRVIATAGFNKKIMWEGTVPGRGTTFNEWIDEMSFGDVVDFIVGDIERGVDGTGLKCGVAKFGTGYNTIHALEDKTIRAVLAAHKETGVPIHAHTEVGTMALEQLDILADEGVDPARLTIAHLDRNPDPWLHLKVAETGAFLSFDGITRVKYQAESVRTELILNLVRHGHEKQVMVGGDIARRSMFSGYGLGGLGMGYILEKWRPRFIEEAGNAGFDGARLLDLFFVENPKRAFAFSR